jgi:hypothetical protein
MMSSYVIATYSRIFHLDELQVFAMSSPYASGDFISFSMSPGVGTNQSTIDY